LPLRLHRNLAGGCTGTRCDEFGGGAPNRVRCAGKWMSAVATSGGAGIRPLRPAQTAPPPDGRGV